MKKYIYILLILSLGAFYACSNDDDFSSEPGLQLTFSSDTIRFDTVFTNMGSATKQFKIYNHNSSSLVIETVELMNPAKSGFKMNIDGEKSTKLSNVEILKKDSLFGFIEVTIDPKDSSNPVAVRDSIRFSVNGHDQFLQLEAVGQDVYIWKNRSITNDTIFTNSKPILVYDSIVIQRGINVTIEEGLTFFMKKSSSLRVHGTLTANGTAANPVIFRTDRFDKIEGDIPYDNVPGQWLGVFFYPESFDNNLENVYVRSAIRGMTFYSSGTQRRKARLYNVMVHNSSEYGVLTTNNKIEAYNCLFSNSRDAALFIFGGDYTFLHCTIANYYRWGGRRTNNVIISDDMENPEPLEKCDFINSIIYGSGTEELLLEQTTENTFNYRFVNCLIKMTAPSDPNFIDVIWNKNPMFKALNAGGNYYYNFELQESSPAINEADGSYAAALPLDMNGKSRIKDGLPDIGCYEW